MGIFIMITRIRIITGRFVWSRTEYDVLESGEFGFPCFTELLVEG